MGHKKSKQARNESFNDDEIRAIEEAFELKRLGTREISAEYIAKKWEDYMLKNLLNVWIQYLFPETKEKLDWGRFSYLNKGQASNFLEVKSNAIFRIIKNVSKYEPPQPVRIVLLKGYFRDILGTYIRCLGCYENPDFFKWIRLGVTTRSSTLRRVLAYLTQDLGNHIAGTVNPKEFEDWLRIHSLIADILTCLLNVAYGLVDVGCPSTSVLPKAYSFSPTILDIAHVIFLSSYLTKNYRKNWRLRFHNEAIGNNFTLLCKNIVGCGPTITVIKDQGHHIFGCFASDSWRQSTGFYGDNCCFMFQLSPILRLFSASGLNNNFMYHNQNQHTLPNGFGMGGQLGFCGLWIDADFGKGHCADFCGTFFNYERPSVSTNFTFTHIEVWALDSHESEEDTVITESGRLEMISDQRLQSLHPPITPHHIQYRPDLLGHQIYEPPSS